MLTKTKKTSNCVEAKNRIQAELLAEYEARKDEFPSYVAFIRAGAEESDWIRRMRRKFGRGEKK
jgi:hypothetical protein